jgi:hypothetical protein
MFERFIETNEPRKLPLSRNKYWISISGTVTKDGVEVKPSRNSLGDLVVQIESTLLLFC